MNFPFTANNQEEFDRAISERLTREAKKYEGFETFKAASAELDALKAKDYPGQLAKVQNELGELKNQLTAAQNEAKTKSEADAASIADLTSKLAASDLVNLRVKVALENGLSYSLAERLKGTTEEELKADASTLAPLFKTNPSQPLGGGDPSGNEPNPAAAIRRPDGTRDEQAYTAALAQLSNSLFSQ